MIRALAATLAATLALALPLQARAIEIEPVTSPGGIDAWLVEEHSIPFAAIELRFMGGASEDAPGARGATHLMAALLEEGAAGRDAQAFAEAAEALAARMSFDAGADGVTVSMEFLTENRDASLALLRDALVAPRFDPEAVERVRGQVLAGLAAAETDPEAIARATLAGLAYPGHPYGTPIEGTAESVAALDADDLRAAHARALTRDRVHVGVTGDVTAEALGPILDALLGELPRAEGAPVGPAADALEGGVTVVDFPAPQSVVLFGHEGIAFDDPDFIAATILNHVLGGAGFESRLMTELRERRGLTYGIGSALAPREHAAQVLGQFATANATVGEAVDLVRGQWAALAEEGVTPEELAQAKTYLTGAYPLRFDGNARIAGILAGMQESGLPIDYPNFRNDLVEAVTLEDVARVARRVLRPEGLHFVVVGQPEGVEAAAAR